MPINGFSVGRDQTLTIVANGAPVRFSGITGFRSKQDTTEQKIVLIDGNIEHLRFFQGWSGSFTLERRNGVLDRFFNTLEANYYLGVSELPVFIDQVIREADGSVTSEQYTKVLLKLDDAGEWRGDSNVKQALSFIGSRRIGQ